MADGFLDRARFEAGRYGSDPWVFVRELLQNARDAGARRVSFRVEPGSPGLRLSCRDDGAGMSFAHARRFLFTLYTSSKEHEEASAGRFGVGFWSILRLGPARIIVRSWPRRGAPWEVVLEGDLSRAARAEPRSGGPPGTEIVLEAARPETGVEQQVFDAAWQAGRYLGQRDRPGQLLAVTVNGRTVNARFELPAPSASFRRGRLRGVVGLGGEPGVELFSKGLRVRSAACLRDLLSPCSNESSEERVRRRC